MNKWEKYKAYCHMLGLKPSHMESINKFMKEGN